MAGSYDLDEEVRKELKLLQLQLEHSRRERKKRDEEKDEEKRRELSRLKKEIISSDDAETGSAVSGDTASTIGGSTAGQITVKKVRSGPQRNASVTLEKDTGKEREEGAMSPPNAAELKRQRELEQQKKREQREMEEKKRLDAQKADPAKEKGGDVKYYTKAKLRGWTETSAFAVARPAGLFFYKSAPAGRGSTTGGITYDDSAKPVHVVHFSVQETNSRGTTVDHKSSCNVNPSVVDHEKLTDKTDLSLHFTVSYFDPKAKAFQCQLVRCETKNVRDGWGKFLAKYIKVQGLEG
eukprot:TRINITY_DN13830_c0_g1_i2.p1 TRINITY_DN13830_c0_g1~~TRINITY_DN13830_c0_g1_i2.p1  ORF type:complete len:295 (+),score=96.33 TRINITY_DN13830_c0_g1_i2:110-994(+)